MHIAHFAVQEWTVNKMTIDGAIKYCKEEAEKYMEYGIETECYQCGKEHEQLAEWLTELKEAKRLLKAAVEDLEELHSEADCSCNCCKGEKAESCLFIKCWTWRYADEALKLIGDD